MSIESRTTLVTVAAAIYFITGLPYAVGSIPVTAHLVKDRTLPIFAGITFWGGSFLARQGMNWVIASSVAFILVGVAQAVAGFLLWNSLKSGAILALVSFPAVMAISIGGGAPIPLLIEPVKMLLVFLAWSSLD